MPASQSPGAAIEVRGLHKAFKELKVLRGVDLAVARGSIFALLGSNGAGKTTVVKILSMLLKADAGTVGVNGFDVASQAAEVRESIRRAGPASSDFLPTGHAPSRDRAIRLSCAQVEPRIGPRRRSAVISGVRRASARTVRGRRGPPRADETGGSCRSRAAHPPRPSSSAWISWMAGPGGTPSSSRSTVRARSYTERASATLPRAARACMSSL
jgi:energy-coupling factor transporter ATP-binding protein EcfA2